MRPVNFIEFDADLPDDSAEDASHNIVTPGWRQIAELIAAKAAKTNSEVTQPRQHSFYGWNFWVQYPGVNIYCLLQRPGKWLLLIRARRTVLDRLLFRTRNNEVNALTDLLIADLRGDLHFSGIVKYTAEEFETMRLDKIQARKSGSTRSG